MRQSVRIAAAAFIAIASAASLADVCTVSNLQAALPFNGTLLGINLLPSSVTVNTVTNATSMGSTTSCSYCNVTISYEHPGKDQVVVWYTLPSPDEFMNCFYVAGGGGYSLSSSPTGRLTYGAVAGITDAGYDAIDGVALDDVVFTGNGSVNYDNVYMFAYKALGAMTTIGKAITPGFYGLDTDTKIYTYYEGCSDGGREGWSQVQRWGEEYDGVIVGAPAFRYGQQQVNHLISNVVEQTMDYFPPPCEMEKIVNLTISVWDSLDGRTDGVVSRTDLCNLSSLDNVTLPFPTSLPLYSNGGKIIHYHGESDNSVPPASSIHYYDSVRTIVYPDLSYNESVAALGDWYKFFLVSDAAHCSTNTLQPGPYPEDSMATMIDWIENGVEPTRLNATVSSGTYEGEVQKLCSWPTRPHWTGNSSSFDCEYNQASIDS